MKCAHCSDTETQACAVTIDGVELRTVLMLCNFHKERLLLRLGIVLGSLDLPLDEVARKFAVAAGS